MAGPSEADESDGGTDEATDGADADGADDESGSETETVGGRRMVEAGAGADVPVDDDGEPSGAAGEADPSDEASPDPSDVASDGGGTDAADEDAVTFEDIVEDDSDYDDEGADADDDSAPGADGDTASPTAGGGDATDDDPETDAVDATAERAAPSGATDRGEDETDDADEETDDADDESADTGGDGDGDETADADEHAGVPPELRQLLAENDDAEVADLLNGATENSTAAETASGSGADGYGVSEHRPAEPTDLAPTDASGEDIATTEEADEPAAETEPVSMRSEMAPVLAERQAFLALLLALGTGALFATLGNVLRLTRWQTVMVLVSAGIVVLLIATFVVFRAMLAAAERNDEPYKSAYTHPLFMFLFGVTTVVTALFVGYVSRLLT